MAGIVQQTQVYGFADTVACPAFGSAVTQGNAIALVAFTFPVSLAASNSPTISDGTANVYNLAELLLASTHVWPVVFTTPPTGTSGTITSAYGGAGGSTVTIIFSDGEIRRATITNGGTSVTWLTALTGSPTVNATTYDNTAGFAMWYVQNSVAGTVTPQFATSGGGTQALYAAEINGVGTSGIYLGSNGNVQFAPGTGADAITSTSLSISQSAVLFGFSCDTSTLTTAGPTGGSGFAAQSQVWNTGTFNAAIAESAVSSTSKAATFTATTGADTFYSLAMALAQPVSSLTLTGPLTAALTAPLTGVV